MTAPALKPIAAARQDGKFDLPADGFVQLMPLGEFPASVEFGSTPPGDVEGLVQDADGRWRLPIVQVIDAEAVRRCAESHAPDMLIDYEHASNRADGESRAAGWTESVAPRADGLFAAIRWTADGLADVTGGNYRYLSPVFPWDKFEHLGGDRYRPTRLDGAGLTNTPNLRGIRAVSNRRRKTENGIENANPYRDDDGKLADAPGGGKQRKVESVDEVLRDADSDAKSIVSLGRTSPDEVRRIKEATGFDATDYEHVLTADAVRHIRKFHPEISDEQIRNYRSLAASAEGIKATVTDQNLPAIEYRKRINGDLLIIQERRDKKGVLALTTMKKEKAGAAYAGLRQPSPYAQGGPGKNKFTPGGGGVKPAPNPLNPRVGNTGTAPEQAERKKETETMRDQLIQALGLPPEATDEDVLKAVSGLQQRLNEIEQAQAEALVENDLKELGDRVVNRDVVKAALLKDRAGTLAVLNAVKKPEAKPAIVLNAQQAKTPVVEAIGADRAKEQERAVEKYRVENKCSRKEAWAAVRRERPELFKQEA